MDAVLLENLSKMEMLPIELHYAAFAVIFIGDLINIIKYSFLIYNSQVFTVKQSSQYSNFFPGLITYVQSCVFPFGPILVILCIQLYFIGFHIIQDHGYSPGHFNNETVFSNIHILLLKKYIGQ